MTFFYDLNKKLADLAKGKEQLTEGAQAPVAEGSTGDYSAKKARAGKDIGKPGKAFAKIARGAAERYGSKERGEKVAGAVLAKLRKGVGEAAKPDYIDLDKDGNRTEPMKQAASQSKGMKEAGPGRDMTKDLVRAIEKKSGGKETAQRDAKGVLQLIKKKKSSQMDEVKLADLPVRQVKGRAYGAEPEEFDQNDDDDTPAKRTAQTTDGAPRKRGRPKGTGRSIGAKGPTGRSKLLKKGSLREADIEIQDQGEYDQEGDMAKDDIHTLVRDAQALEKILGDNDNLPEWVQAKLTKAKGMISAVSDYMQTERERAGEKSMDVELDEKAVSKAQRRAAGIAHAAQKGEIPKSELRGASKEMAKMGKKELHKFAATKEKGLPKKKSKEEVEETTTSGSVATAPAAAPKKGGMQFGKGIYDSLNRDLEAMISESMSVNISSSTEGSPSITVTATDEDAAQLAQILKAAGIGADMGGHSESCPTCGQSPCGCAEQVDENQPDWPTNTETSNDALQYSGGLNKPKTTVAGDGQTTVPVTAVQVREGEEQLDESTCNECGMYESRCECDKEEDMDESIQRMQNLAGIQEAKPDFLDIDKDGDKKEPMKKAADEKDDKKVEESFLNLNRLWKEYKA